MDNRDVLKYLDKSESVGNNPLLSDVLAQAPASFTMPIAIGKSKLDRYIIADLSKSQNLLIAGASGSGKTMCINSVILSLLCCNSQNTNLVLIDTKGMELSMYNGISNLLLPVIRDARTAFRCLEYLAGEIEKRYLLFAQAGVKDIASYNKKAVSSDDEYHEIKNIVIVIDEIAELIMYDKKIVEQFITHTFPKARPAGVYLVLGTMRLDFLSKAILMCFPSRAVFMLPTVKEYRAILGQPYKNLPQMPGEMLFQEYGTSIIQEVYGSVVSDKEIIDVTSFMKQEGTAYCDDTAIEEINNWRRSEYGWQSESFQAECEVNWHEDENFILAVEIALESGQISTSIIQRRLRIGYARAGRITDMMERAGIISQPMGASPRTVLITREEWQKTRMNMGL